VALRTRTLLQAAGANVVMTKTRENEPVTNKRRAEIANRANADLMVRLHCDSEGGSGTATFYPDRAGRAPGGARGPRPEVIVSSIRVAKAFHPAMMQVLKPELRDRGCLPDLRTYIGGKQGGALTGSIYSEVPVLLVELCVLTHWRDERFAASEAGLSRFARALTAGTIAALSS
jgi:N-acetylmuramoyl-L-alanine amidase